MRGLVRYEPSSHHPLHKHDFAQVWYILEGQFQIGEGTYGPARCCSIRTRTGRRHCRRRPAGSCSSCNTRGRATGGQPIYDGRFNMTARKAVAEENLER